MKKDLQVDPMANNNLPRRIIKVAETPQKCSEEIETYARYRYPAMTKTQGNFNLKVMEGEFIDSQTVVMLGGKTTFIRMLPADIYLIDEPSAYLDSEQRIVASKFIKRFILHAKKTAVVVEHDFIMATYLADRVILYEGKPSIDCKAN
ncbi:aliphatic sulfonates import ATP-binding protein SsuB [Striga asiatica]|uniref:Aliphatic sulfonates import ATP-binding protein SsuB n=1 Tax=Striga asiatica TaxID=4170 RepID=A0A5A7Q635_STRAF|nr:aliphatic sulfonates import ATP-binding protein SsuB [Striga asiatica]